MTDLVAGRERFTRTFLRLAQIDSPALQEADMASAVQAELRGLGWDVIDDRTGPQVGNPFAPGLRDGVIESDGTTVLGADAKAAVAALAASTKKCCAADRQP